MKTAPAKQVYDKLLSVYGPQKCFLEHMTPFQLLVATILSAQCTDKRVNMVTRDLFRRWPDARAFAGCSQDELEQAIFTCGFYHAKATHIIAASKAIVEQFHGELPRTMEGLLRLPGVGRKTANVMMAVAFDQPAMPVDTHVFRVANRIGLTKNSKNVLETEKTLVAHLPREVVSKAHHWLILHGRYVCIARKPKCAECGITASCDYFQKKQKEA